MRALGIDPGSRNTGLGLVEISGDALCAVEFRKISMRHQQLADRLGIIFAGVQAFIRDYQPDVVAVEQVFVANNAKSALALGQARGAAICAAISENKSVHEYSALQIKRAVVGTGGAAKEQVQHMVRVLLGLTQLPQTDEADALACAICHIHTTKSQDRLCAYQANRGQIGSG